jgi:DNA adenine methylase
MGVSKMRDELRGQVVNVASVAHRSPFRYPGGKTWLVPLVRRWLCSLDHKPKDFAEPFAGGAIVGLSAIFEDLAEHLTIVERDENVGSVWQVILGGQAEELAERIVSFPISKTLVQETLKQEPALLLDRAFQTILRNRVQRGGIMAPGATLMREGENGRGVASRWYAQTLATRIRDIGKQSKRIDFTQGDGIQFIRKNARRSNMVFFIDPPYTVAGRRLYAYSELDHEDLFRVTSKVKGDFLMTYDDAGPIRMLACRFGFDCHEVPMKNTHHTFMTELLIGRDLGWTRHLF